jgi:hypothetical protein
MACCQNRFLLNFLKPLLGKRFIGLKKGSENFWHAGWLYVPRQPKKYEQINRQERIRK